MPLRLVVFISKRVLKKTRMCKTFSLNSVSGSFQAFASFLLILLGFLGSRLPAPQVNDPNVVRASTTNIRAANKPAAKSGCC